MSRAFVKEHDDDDSEPRLALVRETNHLVTVRGMALLLAARHAAADAERARLERRIASAIVASPPVDCATIAFGATVLVHESSGRERSVTIVGEDEVDVTGGKIGEASPLAVALLSHRVGDVVCWRRPVGDLNLTIASLSYDALRA